MAHAPSLYTVELLLTDEQNASSDPSIAAGKMPNRETVYPFLTARRRTQMSAPPESFVAVAGTDSSMEYRCVAGTAHCC